MSRREDIENTIWGDSDFGALPPNAKLLYLWSFTNPACGMAGIYKLRQGLAAFELGISEDAERAAWDQLEQARFAFYLDGVLWIRSRVKHLRTRGTNMAKSIAKDVAQIRGDHPLRARFLDTYGQQPWLQSVLEPLQDPSDTPDLSIDQAVSGTPPEGSRARDRARERERALVSQRDFMARKGGRSSIADEMLQADPYDAVVRAG